MIHKLLINGKVEIKIYSSRNGMRKAIRKFGPYKTAGLESIVIPCDIRKFNQDGSRGPKFKRVFLFTHKNITWPVLVHESLHIATTLMRNHKQSLKISDRNIDLTEEKLAYWQTFVMEEILKHFKPTKNSDYGFTVEGIERWALGSRKHHK